MVGEIGEVVVVGVRARITRRGRISRLARLVRFASFGDVDFGEGRKVGGFGEVGDFVGF